MITVEVHSDARIRRREVDAARRAIAAVDRYVDGPCSAPASPLRRISPKAARPYVADATVLLDGRLVAAHAAGRDPKEAAEAAADRLRRQIRRLVGADVAQRNEPRAIREALESLPAEPMHRPAAHIKPPGGAPDHPAPPYIDVPLSTLEAVDELLAIDVEFFLFDHVRSSEWVTVYRRDDGRIGLLFPPGSVLADENDVVVPSPAATTVR